MKGKALFGALALALGSHAVADTHSPHQGGFFGLKAGQMQVDASDDVLGIDYDNSTNIGVYAGYVGESGLGFEAEFTWPTSDADTGVPDVTYELSTVALYGTWRSDGNIYFKGRAGLLRERLKLEGPGGTASDSDSGLSFGAGVGFHLGSSRLELEFTRIEKDVNYLSIGFIF